MLPVPFLQHMQVMNSFIVEKSQDFLSAKRLAPGSVFRVRSYSGNPQMQPLRHDNHLGNSSDSLKTRIHSSHFTTMTGILNHLLRFMRGFLRERQSLAFEVSTQHYIYVLKPFLWTGCPLNCLLRVRASAPICMSCFQYPWRPLWQSPKKELRDVLQNQVFTQIKI